MRFILLVISCLSVLSSCSSIIKGTSQAVTFNSSPTGADVFVDGINMGQTPVTLKLKKNTYETIMIKKKGYQAATRPLNKEYDALTLLNVFWDSSTTDLISGAAYEYEPNSYNFTLVKKSEE